MDWSESEWLSVRDVATFEASRMGGHEACRYIVHVYIILSLRFSTNAAIVRFFWIVVSTFAAQILFFFIIF